MKKNKNMKLWIIVIIIWVSASFAAYRNGETIDQTNGVKEKQEVYKLEERFLKGQSNSIPDILKKAEDLYQSVEAPKIGILSLERELHLLASHSGLEKMEMKIAAKKNEGSDIPVTVSFKGPLRNAVEWLGTVRKDYPFIVIRQVDIGNDLSREQTIFQILLNYRCRVVSSN